MKVTKGYNRQGAVNTVRIKRVCQTCNNGWMSQHEARVRPYLTDLIQGNQTFLDAAARQTLAEYITYKIMIADWIDEGPILPVEMAEAFYKTRAMPPYLCIRLFYCVEGGWRLALHTEAYAIDRIGDWHPDLAKNTKSFAIGLGDLFVLAVASTKLDVDLQFEGSASHFQLWPPEGGLLNWPLPNPITNDEAQYIATALQRIGDNPMIIDFGDLRPE